MAKRIVFFNNKGGVGKTTLVYHIAYMLNELGYKVLAADFDPQTNLTAMFLPQERLEEIFLIPQQITVTDAMQPVFESESYQSVHLERIITESFLDMHLMVGNLMLSAYEDDLSDAWTKCLNGKIEAFKKTIIFHTMLKDAENQCNADYTLIDIGPNLGAINRAVLTASDVVILPVGADLFSLQGITNLGATLKHWKRDWFKRMAEMAEKPIQNRLELPQAKMQPLGYIAMQHTAKESRPVKAYLRWVNRIPKTYLKAVLDQDVIGALEMENDTNCLGMLRHYHSLMPMAMEVRKPIFLLKPADGAIGAHFQAVRRVYQEFETVAKRLISVCNP
jgi:chromosome partitioning protein